MADEKRLSQAKTVYQTICRAFDANGWFYERNDEELKLQCKAKGEDLPMEFDIIVDAERALVLMLSHLPFVTAEDKRIEMAIAVSTVNNRLVDGCFDFDVKSGHMFFRMTNSFLESIMGEDVFGYMLTCSFRTIDDFNDKLLMLAKGMITVEQFLDSLQNN